MRPSVAPSPDLSATVKRPPEPRRWVALIAPLCGIQAGSPRAHNCCLAHNKHQAVVERNPACTVNVLLPTCRKLKPYCVGIVELAIIWFNVLSVQPHLKSFACPIDLPLRYADVRQAHTAVNSFQLGHGKISFIHYRVPGQQSWNRVLSLKVHRNNLPKR